MRRLTRTHQVRIRKQAKHRRELRQRAVAAGTAAAITLGAGVGINKALAVYTPDPHELAVSQDADADLLANTEEVAFRYCVFKADQNRNGIPDGVELAKCCAVVIGEMPFGPDPIDPGKTYIDHLPQLGLEQCDICPTTVNMGPAWIVNPQLGITVECPLIAIHYMEHGSFSYGGDVHNGRLDVAALLQALDIRYPCEPNDHLLPVEGNDSDGDFLTDGEELELELEAGFSLYNPDPYDADQDEDLTPDGVELAKQCAEIINQLPWQQDAAPSETYKWLAGQFGLETCDICGATVNMGPAGIVNPQLDLSVDCPLIAMHYMNHGSFNYLGDVHGAGRVHVAALVKVLEMPRRCGDLGTIYMPSDLNRDCKTDFVDFSGFADRWLQSTDPNDGSDIEY